MQAVPNEGKLNISLFNPTSTVYHQRKPPSEKRFELKFTVAASTLTNAPLVADP